MVVFERRLWALARNYHALAQQAPKTLVDIARIVEMQEQASGRHVILCARCIWHAGGSGCTATLFTVLVVHRHAN